MSTRLPSQILALARIYGPPNEPVGQRRLVILTAYADDSGTHDPSHNCVIAGYWGTARAWRHFERRWIPVLESEGVEEFHAKEFWQRVNGERLGSYKGWSDYRHADFLDRLLHVIETSDIFPFACGVLKAEWSKFPPEQQNAMASQGHARRDKPQYMAMQTTILRLLTYCKPPRKLNFVFDYCEELKADYPRVFQAVRNLFAEVDAPQLKRIGQFTLADPKDVVPLQAADLLANRAHRYAKEARGNPRRLPAIEYLRAFSKIRNKDDFMLWDEARFRPVARLFENIEKRRK